MSAKGRVILMGYAQGAAAYREASAVREETGAFQLALAHPERYEDAAGIARRFDARHMVAINLEGVAYAKGGELVRIAKNAFLLVPGTAAVENTLPDEWGDIGKY